MNKYFIIDFDSTFTNVEALDLLGEISLASFKDQKERLDKIKQITDQGMDGGMSFRESLEERLKLLKSYQDRMRDDPEFVEKVAREELGLAKPGETVIRFVDEPKTRRMRGHAN